MIRLLGDEAVILRTAWLYSPMGPQLRAHHAAADARSGTKSAWCSDQVGTPDLGRSLAEAIWAAASRPEVRGIHHWTDAGVASWYDFAVAIQEEALALGLLRRHVPIRPLRTDEYPTAAQRPPYSVLDATMTWSGAAAAAAALAG